MEKSENARRSHCYAEAGKWLGFKKQGFSDFFIGPVFFIAIRLRIRGDGSAPHFAANAILKIIGEFESSIFKVVATTKF